MHFFLSFFIIDNVQVLSFFNSPKSQFVVIYPFVKVKYENKNISTNSLTYINLFIFKKGVSNFITQIYLTFITHIILNYFNVY